MKISALNITDSINITDPIRNLYNKTSQGFSRIGQLITQIWDRIIGNKQPKENFISYINDHNFKLVKPRNSKEFFSFEADFISTFNWVPTALQDPEALYLKKIIEKFDIHTDQFTYLISSESERAKKEVEKADQEQQEQVDSEVKSHKDVLNDLGRKEQEELKSRHTELEKELSNSQKTISSFESLTGNITDEYMGLIKDVTQAYDIQSEELSNITENLTEMRKKFAISTKNELSKNLLNDFSLKWSKIEEEIKFNYNEKRKDANKDLQEKLKSLENTAVNRKNNIKQNLQKKIDFINSEIEAIYKDLKTTLCSQIQKELENANKELKKADQEQQKQVDSEVKSHKDVLNDLGREEQEKLKSRHTELEKELSNSQKTIFEIQSSLEKLANIYMRCIKEVTQESNIQCKESFNMVEKLTKQHKKSASSIAQELLENVEKDFYRKLAENQKDIQLKYNEKRKNANKNLQETLDSIEKTALNKKETIKQNSEKNINFIPINIEDICKNLCKDLGTRFKTTFRSLESENDEVEEIFYDALEECESIKEDTLQESEFTTNSIEQSTDSIGQSANSLELSCTFSLKKDKEEEEKKALSEDSLMITIHKTYTFIQENLSGAFTIPFRFRY